MIRGKLLLILSLVAITILVLTIVQLIISVLLPGIGYSWGLFPLWWSWWLIDIAAYAIAITTLILAGMGLERFIRNRIPVDIDHLRSAMISTSTAVIGATIFVIATLAYLFGASFIATVGFIAFLFAAIPSFISWLISPALINLSYGCRYDPELQEIVNSVAMRAGIDPPKAMVSEIPIPNAFAYSSPIMGRYVAVTRGLMKVVRSREELEAVIGHELGHHKHRDNAIMMIFGLFPSVIYFLGRFMLFAGMTSRYADGGSNRRRESSGGSLLLIVGIILIVISILIQIAVLALSRLREHYADAHGAKVTSPRAMINALNSLDTYYRSYGAKKWLEDSKIKALFIYALTEPFFGLEEVLSTHPPIQKRIKFLENLMYRPIEA